MTKKKEMSFEESLSRLEEISELLEGEGVGVDEIIKLYEEGMKLSKKCYSKLKDAELKITELTNELKNDLSELSDDEE